MNLIDFIIESNRIESIHRPPTRQELAATEDFLGLARIQISDLEKLVSVYAPGNRLRDQDGLDVRVGSYYPPKGGYYIRYRMESLLNAINQKQIDAYHAHLDYENIHPFTDGNGRSGRTLWLWMMGGEAPIGFLHRFYYQTLDAQDKRSAAEAKTVACHCFGPGHEPGCPTLFEAPNPNCTCYFPNGDINLRPCAVHSMRMEDR